MLVGVFYEWGTSPVVEPVSTCHGAWNRTQHRGSYVGIARAYASVRQGDPPATAEVQRQG